jgi:hypothetical protein
MKISMNQGVSRLARFSLLSMRRKKRRKEGDTKMRCENFNSAKEVCCKGMPVADMYKDLICEKRPEKCPLVIGVLELKAASRN